MSNTTEKETTATGLDLVKWVLVFALLAASVWGYQHFTEYSELIRFGGFILALVISLALVLTTQKGKSIKQFSYEANIERKKVVWPTYKETNTTTLIVGVMVILVSILLYFIDSILVWAINFVLA